MPTNDPLKELEAILDRTPQGSDSHTFVAVCSDNTAPEQYWDYYLDALDGVLGEVSSELGYDISDLTFNEFDDWIVKCRFEDETRIIDLYFNFLSGRMLHFVLQKRRVSARDSKHELSTEIVVDKKTLEEDYLADIVHIASEVKRAYEGSVYQPALEHSISRKLSDVETDYRLQRSIEIAARRFGYRIVQFEPVSNFAEGLAACVASSRNNPFQFQINRKTGEIESDTICGLNRDLSGYREIGKASYRKIIDFCNTVRVTYNLLQ